MVRIPYSEAHTRLAGILKKRGFDPESAALSARLFCDANRDGVLSHGLARFPNYLAAIDSGRLFPDRHPRRILQMGALERWDGQRGPGNLNAWKSMARALEIAGEQGVGCVALSETNHWMRAGNFGWQAVEAGMIGMCWTNTMPNLPPWGSAHPLIGNNPLVVAIPRIDGPVVLDMALSQFSYGALSRHSLEERTLPVEGGYDRDGKLTRDAAAIQESMRPLPVGFWKGSGLSIVLDLLAALLSGGNATCDIRPEAASESGISQVFLAFNPPGHPGLADRVVESLRSRGEEVRYPGEQTLQNRRESEKLGIPVEKELWDRLSSGDLS